MPELYIMYIFTVTNNRSMCIWFSISRTSRIRSPL